MGSGCNWEGYISEVPLYVSWRHKDRIIKMKKDLSWKFVIKFDDSMFLLNKCFKNTDCTVLRI